jgi:hypothetical protein
VHLAHLQRQIVNVTHQVRLADKTI